MAPTPRRADAIGAPAIRAHSGDSCWHGHMSAEKVDPADRAAAAELLARYAEAVDDGAFEAVGGLLAAAVLEDAEGRPVAEGAEQIAALYRSTTRRHADGTPMTTHLITNVIVDAVGPDELEVRSRFCVLQATDQLALQPVVTGRYADRMERRNGDWVFVRRRMVPERWGDTSQHLTFDPAPDNAGTHP